MATASAAPDAPPAAAAAPIPAITVSTPVAAPLAPAAAAVPTTRDRQQEKLREKVIEYDTVDWFIPHVDTKTDDSTTRPALKRLGGVDLSFVKENAEEACACIVVLDAVTLRVLYESYRMVQLKLPYVPGLLAFREAPFILALIDELVAARPDLIPDVILCDGNGVLHPRGMGIASHLGVLSGIPTIGVAKKFLHVDNLHKHDVLLLAEKHNHKAGDAVNIVGASGRVWGAAYRATDESTNPVFVSVGHGLSLDTALKIVRSCSRYRVPEPVRQADLRSRDYLREMGYNAA